MEVDEATLQEASVEVQSLKRQETQDYVRETLAISQEEAEEMGFRAKYHE